MRFIFSLSLFFHYFFLLSHAGLPLKKAQVKSKDGEWIYLHNHHPSDSLEFGPPPADDVHLSSETIIFVSLASLHDSRCGRTLHNLLTHAEFPERVQFGVVAQDAPETPDCVDTMCALFQNKEIGEKSDPGLPCPFKENIRIMRLSDQEAQGPVVARALVHTMMDDIPENSFCLTLDAHSYGMENWDVELLKEWGWAKNEMAVLTTYMGDKEFMGENVMGMFEVPHLCKNEFHNGFPSNTRATAARYLGAPILAPLWAAGMSFSKCHAEIRAPYDPHLKYLWEGEEYGRAARLFTNGYDLYTPSRNILAHDWVRVKDQKKWDRPTDVLIKSEKRLKSILLYKNSNQDPAYKKSLGVYDLGINRTLSEYANFCGTDTQTEEISFNYCIDYEWVSWKWKQSEIDSLRKMKWKNVDPEFDPFLPRIHRYGPDSQSHELAKKRHPSSTRSLLQARESSGTEKDNSRKKSSSKKTDIQKLASALKELKRNFEASPSRQDIMDVIEDLNRRVYDLEHEKAEKKVSSAPSAASEEQLSLLRADIQKQKQELQKQNLKISHMLQYRNETLRFANLKHEGDVTIRWLIYVIMGLVMLCFNGWLCCFLSRYVHPSGLKRA